MRHRGAQLVLPSRWNTARGEKGGAKDHAGSEFLVEFAAQTPMIIRQGIEVEILDEAIKSHRYTGAPGEVVVDNTVIQGEYFACDIHPFSDLSVGHLVDPHPEIVELQNLDVRSERCRKKCEVGRDVEHSRVQVAHQPVSRMAESSRDMRSIDPLLDAAPCRFLAQPP